LKCLYDRVDFERTRALRLQRDSLKLDRMRALVAELGDPQEGLRCIHVAGTKGKGSICAMLAASLEECGYAVGVYTSPHLVDVRERMQISGSMISHADFTRLLGKVETAAQAIEKAHGKPTFFEMLTALSLLWFADQAVDVAVFEVGLGGRLDATNVITPEIAIISSISLDHTQLLGDTVGEIAREKAGIMKPGVPVITMTQAKEVLEVFREEAERVGASLEVLGKDIEFSYRFEATPKLGPHTCVCLTTPRSSFEHVDVPLPGEHQALNCGLALAALDKLRERGVEAPEPRVIEGLARTTLPGRMELAWSDPRILLDGAHNEASVQALMRSIGVHVPYDSLVVVFGCGEDKDVASLLKCVAGGADKVIFTRAQKNPRAVPPKELQQTFTRVSGKMSQVADSLPEALDLAARAVSRGDLICVTGSFHLVGEAKKHLEGLKRRRAAGEKIG
jgi:dihydrofolate synthase/folylpolyglutamate synthase